MLIKKSPGRPEKFYVSFHCQISPDHKSALDSIAFTCQISQGETVMRLIDHYKATASIDSRLEVIEKALKL